MHEGRAFRILSTPEVPLNPAAVLGTELSTHVLAENALQPQHHPNRRNAGPTENAVTTIGPTGKLSFLKTEGQIDN